MKIDFAAQSKKDTVKRKTNSVFNREVRLLPAFNNKRKEAFYREFGLLLRSGIDFGKALELLIYQEKNKQVKEVLEKIRADIIAGKPLYESFSSQKEFTDYETFSLKAGEEVRRLPEVLIELQRFFNRKIKVRRQITSVLAYPIFVLLITIAVLYFMLNYVVPMFSSIFEQFGGTLPKITRFVVYISSKFNLFALIFLVICLSLFLIHKQLKSNKRYLGIYNKALIKIPIFGPLIKKIAIAKFCQIMGLLLSARTPLDQALKMASDITTFYPLKQLVQRSILEIEKGNTLYNILNTGFFEPKTLTLISIGEEVNELDAMFSNLSDQINEEIDHSTKLIGTIVEPLMIVIIAIIVGFILIAMYYPMTNISEVLTNR